MEKKYSYINYHGNNVAVSTKQETGENEKRYLVHLPQGDLEIYKKEDNEGGSHWFETGKDRTTAASDEMGLIIEQQLLK